MRNGLIVGFIAAAMTIFSAGAALAKDPVYTGRFSNLAVDGHDVVSYFTEGAKVRGLAEFETKYMGAVWRFSSAENLAKFKADPTAYAPQYGGYCAWAAARGYTARGNPKNWNIVDGKLYLNYDDNVEEKWKQDIAGFIAKADANWPGILDK